MINLYSHQKKDIEFLASKPSAMLANEMGTGKTRTAMFAARKLFDALKVDRVLVCAPSAVLIAWREELQKLSREGFNFNLLEYKPKDKQFRVEAVGGNLNHDRRHMPIALISYSLLQREAHLKAALWFAAERRCALVCDESSFLKSRTAKQTKATHEIAKIAVVRWLLSGTPVCNSPLDLYAQGKVMAPAGGPLSGIGRPGDLSSGFYVFEAMFGCKTPVVGRNGQPVMITGKDRTGRVKRQVLKQWHPDAQKLKQLTKRFAPYVSRVEKKDCLDLPDKSYTVREVQLTDETWKIYQELRREAMLTLPDSEARPEPNAGVRLLRLCQLTSGHVGTNGVIKTDGEKIIEEPVHSQDVSSEKLDWLAEQIVSGELAGERALIIWCRWRRERERMKLLLEKATYESFKKTEEHMLFPIYEIFGGQKAREREEQIQNFQCSQQQHMRTVLLAQQHAGGFGLNLTAASTAIYLSNDWSYSTRVQSEDRTHRIGQRSACLYVDVVATGPKGQRTVDHAILEALREKKSLAEWTCAQWRRALEE